LISFVFKVKLCWRVEVMMNVQVRERRVVQLLIFEEWTSAMKFLPWLGLMLACLFIRLFQLQ
ncbi:hypothetical protein AALP_AAs44998U000100, partial [Arabis alpina]